jgi:ABC-type Zn uptake system ZnuABC Zn-binding protein ZnuA
LGADPHAYSPSTQDAEKIVNANIVIINGANLESFIAPILQNSISNQLVVTASDGLTVQKDPTGMNPEGDPHFWLDPNNVIIYTENIEKGFSKAFPSDQDYFQANSQKYIAELQDLDTWIKLQVQSIPAHRRLLVTNHETFGYFAGRYGFTVVGAIIPGFSSEAATSAQEVADLVRQIHLTNAPAIFLETGSNPQLAQQVAAETGVKVIYGLYTHSLSNIGGPAPTYIDMMKYDVTVIVEALK